MNKQLKAFEQKLTKALGLLSLEERDNVIATTDYHAIVSGADAHNKMTYMLARSLGLRNTKKAQKQFAQSGMVLLQLVHIAYALGVRHGRGE